jgi:hypothetical protein
MINIERVEDRGLQVRGGRGLPKPCPRVIMLAAGPNLRTFPGRRTFATFANRQLTFATFAASLISFAACPNHQLEGLTYLAACQVDPQPFQPCKIPIQPCNLAESNHYILAAVQFAEKLLTSIVSELMKIALEIKKFISGNTSLSSRDLSLLLDPPYITDIHPGPDFQSKTEQKLNSSLIRDLDESNSRNQKYIYDNNTLSSRALASLIESKFNIKIWHLTIDAHLQKARADEQANNGAKVEAVRSAVLDDTQRYAGKSTLTSWTRTSMPGRSCLSPGHKLSGWSHDPNRECQGSPRGLPGNPQVSYSAWREQDHDDLVLSAALAAWWAEQEPEPTTRLPSPSECSIEDEGPYKGPF